ncbi:hypothetical protein Aduo_006256 [Ancylostoma duodenale]
MRLIIEAIPNIPIEIATLQITMTMLMLPPIPKLNSEFIRDNEDTAIWPGAITPSLRCKSRSNAESLNRTFFDNCQCAAAEFKVRCECAQADVANCKEFDQLQQQVSLKTAYWELNKNKNASLTAKLPQLVSSEIVVNFHQTLDTTTVQVNNQNCAVQSTSPEGCYHCTKGAIATIQWTAEKRTLGEVLRGQRAFVIACAPEAVNSMLRFNIYSA